MKHIEDNLQIACVRWFRLQYPNFYYLMYHNPNGGKRNIREATRFKQMGVVAGVADLTLLVAKQGYFGLFIEMKTDKGKQSEYQKNFQQAVTAQGYKYIVCRSLEDFITEVTNYLK